MAYNHRLEILNLFGEETIYRETGEKMKKALETKAGPQGWFSWRTLERNLLWITLGGAIVISS
jgi:hypothetical protein